MRPNFLTRLCRPHDGQVMSVFSCRLFLISPDQLPKVLARIAILPRAHPIVDVAAQRLRESDQRLAGTFMAASARASISAGPTDPEEKSSTE